MDPFVDKMATLARREGMFGPGARVVAGVSAGPDSTALAWALLELAPTIDLTLTLAHFNHGLRGADADADEAWVSDFAQQLALPLIVQRPGRAPVGNLEDWARAERYRFLFKAASAANASVVAVAHHRDDQAETVLINLLRGAGSQGLAGIAPVRAADPPYAHITLARPLLSHSRAEIMAFLERNRLDFRHDPSNHDLGRLRNRLRHEIIPQLETINPRLRESLARTAAVLRREADALRSAADRCLTEHQGINVELLSNEVPGLRMAVYREAVRRAAGSPAGYAFVHFEAIDRLVMEGPIHGSLDLPGITARRERGEVFLVPDDVFANPDGPLAADAELPVPGRLEWIGPSGARHEIAAERGACPGGVPDPWAEAWLDPAEVKWPLWVRRRRPGDRYRPFGLSGRRKLKDVMNQLRIPPADRDRWPLLADRESIVWVPGMRPAHCATEKEREIIRIIIGPALMPDAKPE